MGGRLIVFVIITFAFVIICSACAQIWTPYNDPNINAQVKQVNTGGANEGTKTLSQTEYDGVANVSIEYWDYGTTMHTAISFIRIPKITKEM